jgi:hypothetical protein
MPREPGTQYADRTPRRWLLLTAALAALVLIYTAGSQIYDTNFYVLWEATALLAGDHPYRDFFEWGVPLQAALSAAGQWLVGYRLIGEFAIQWLAIIAGAVMAFDIGYRLSRALLPSLVGLACALALLSVTPTFHYPKLLLYPLAVRLAWGYLDRPSVRRSLGLGVLIVVAFLFRHDHGVYIGVLIALTMLVTRLLAPDRRSTAGLVREAAAGLAVVIALLAPWAVLVHRNEGLPDYVRYRQELFVEFSAGSPFWGLREMNPWVTFAAADAAATPGIITFDWEERDDEQPAESERRRHEMERRFGLRPTGPPDAESRWSYQVRNVHDPALLGLMDMVNNSDGIDWRLLHRLRWRLPSETNAQRWLMQLSMLVPLLLLGWAAATAAGAWRRGEALPIAAWRMVLAGVFLILIEDNLFREPSYFVIVAPLTAACSTVFMAWPRITTSSPARAVSQAGRALAATVLLLLTAVPVYAYTYGSAIYAPLDLEDQVTAALRQLLASPPIDAYLTREQAVASNQQPVDGTVLVRFLHDCSRPEDRVLITGSTPYHVGYYIERAIAGGQLFWHHRWRTDIQGQRQQLALLQRQSVPFAFSTADPVLNDLANYPLVLEYMTQHYAEVPGTNRMLLVDRRRTPVGTYGPLALPCFR